MVSRNSPSHHTCAYWPSVNVRLLGKRLEQNKLDKPNQWESQQARWPNLFTCPNCWREDHSWGESNVFDHLHSLNWSGNPSYIKIQSNNTGSAVVGGNSSRGIGLRWKLPGIIFVVAAVLMRLSSLENGRSNSGNTQKVKIEPIRPMNLNAYSYWPKYYCIPYSFTARVRA